MPPFAPSDRVVILGAGATLGAKFAEQANVRPPLNTDFFTQLQRTGGKHLPAVKAVIDDVIELFGSNFSLTLEDYFSQLESMIDATRFAPRRVAKQEGAKFRAKRNRLMSALSAVLEASTDEAIRAGNGCARHQTFVKHLRARDTVISFNYDCVMDDALRRVGDGKWTARYGYAFPQPSRVDPSRCSLEWRQPSNLGSVNDSPLKTPWIIELAASGFVEWRNHTETTSASAAWHAPLYHHSAGLEQTRT